MTFVCVCRSCSRTIERAFVYCPWCGAENANRSPFDDEAAVEAVFERLEQKQLAFIGRRIDDIARKLDDLEKEFDSIAELRGKGRV